MRQRMENRGLEGTVVIIKTEDEPVQIDGEKLVGLVKMLNDIDRSVSILGRRGIIFRNFVENYYERAVLSAGWRHTLGS